MMHLTISGILILVKHGNNKTKGFSSWVVIAEIESGVLARGLERYVVMEIELNLEITSPKAPVGTL